jgi:hypothetical protein
MRKSLPKEQAPSVTLHRGEIRIAPYACKIVAKAFGPGASTVYLRVVADACKNGRISLQDWQTDNYAPGLVRYSGRTLIVSRKAQHLLRHGFGLDPLSVVREVVQDAMEHVADEAEERVS